MATETNDGKKLRLKQNIWCPFLSKELEWPLKFYQFRLNKTGHKKKEQREKKENIDILKP